MSENLDENGAPVTEGQEAGPSGSGRRKFIYLALGLVVALVLAGAAVMLLALSKEQPTVQVENENVASRAAAPGADTSEAADAPASAADEPTMTPGPGTATGDETFGADAQVAGSPEILGRIAFINGNGRLGTVLPNGDELRLLAQPGRFYQFPAWSPTNELLAAIGSDFEESGVYVTTGPNSEDLREVYADQELSPIYLYWSPTGEEVSFIALNPDGLALHLAPADGSSDSQVITTAPGSFFWDWLPDAERVLIHTGFRAQEGDDTRTAFVPVGGDGSVSEVEEDGFFQAPVVSADGRHYALGDTVPGGGQWLKVWNIDEEQPRRAIPHQGAISMGWSPTRNVLAYTSPVRPARTFYGPLNLLDVETGAIEVLVPQRVVAFFWSPDGRFIAYLTVSQHVEPEEEGPGLDETSPEASLPPGKRPQAAIRRARVLNLQEQRLLLDLHVADVESGQSRLLYTFEPTDIFVNQFLPFSDQYALSHRLWSPDSKAIVMASSDAAGREQIVVVPLDRSQPTPVAEGNIAFWSHQ